MTIIANILVQRFNKITLLNLWRNAPTRQITESQSLSSGKSKCHKPNPLQNNMLNRDTLILQSSQIRETKIEND